MTRGTPPLNFILYNLSNQGTKTLAQLCICIMFLLTAVIHYDGIGIIQCLLGKVNLLPSKSSDSGLDFLIWLQISFEFSSDKILSFEKPERYRIFAS